MLGDAARLSDINDATGDPAPVPRSVTGDVTIDLPQFPKPAVAGHVDDVQVFELNYNDLPDCTTIPLSELAAWSVFSVEGTMEASIKSQPSFLGLNSARYSLVWPDVGAFGSVVTGAGSMLLPGEIGPFDTPENFTAVIDGPSLAPGERVVDASPAPDIESTDFYPSYTSKLRWTADHPLHARVSIQDADAQTAFVQINGALSIAFGVAAGVLGALALEAVRGRAAGGGEARGVERIPQPNERPQPSPQPPKPLKRRDRLTWTSATWVALGGLAGTVAFIFATFTKRLARRK